MIKIFRATDKGLSQDNFPHLSVWTNCTIAVHYLMSGQLSLVMDVDALLGVNCMIRP